MINLLLFTNTSLAKTAAASVTDCRGARKTVAKNQHTATYNRLGRDVVWNNNLLTLALIAT